MPGKSAPGSGGRSGAAPVASTSASYGSTVRAPVWRFLTSIAWAAGSMRATSCQVRTSTRKKSRNRSGVATNNRRRSAITPPR